MLSKNEPQDFWSEASGNQHALNECYQYCASLLNASRWAQGNEDETGTVDASREVMLVVGAPGCGATALANQLALKLRAAGRNVLSMDKISSLEPSDFSVNLDEGLRIPPDVVARSGLAKAGLNALQLAVLKARKFDCLLIHDVNMYGSDDVTQAASAAVIIQLLRVSKGSRAVILGEAASLGWLEVAFNNASVRFRTIHLNPMPADSRFYRFMTDVALNVLLPCPSDRIEGLDIDAVYLTSGGEVGVAVTTLVHQITETAQRDVSGDDQSLAMWKCDEEAVLYAYSSQEALSATHLAFTSRQVLPRVNGLEAGGEEITCADGRKKDTARNFCDVPLELAQSNSVPTGTELRYDCPAVYNESFSSWIARVAMDSRHIIGYGLGSFLATYCGRDGSDPDLQWSNLELLQCLSLADRRYITAHFSSPWRTRHPAIPESNVDSANLSSGQAMDENGNGRTCSSRTASYYESRNYCPECFKVDLAEGVAPALRLDWRQPHLIVCLRHDRPVLLERLASSTFTILDKAWAAFAEYAGSPASRLTTQFPLQHSSSSHAKANSDRLVQLAARMQTWLSSLTADTAPTKQAAGFLMSYWLQDVSRTGACGFARAYFFNRFNSKLEVRGERGNIPDFFMSDTSRPRDFAVAYWMLGVGFGVISISEAQFIRDTTKACSIPFPISGTEICSAGRFSYGLNQRKIYVELARSILRNLEFQNIKWALE